MNHHQGYIPGVTREFPVIRVSGDQVSETTVEVCTESRVILSLNDVVIGDLSITPTDLEAFAAGHLICEGYISSLEQITGISIDLPEIRVTALCCPGDTSTGRFSKNSSGGPCRDLLPAGEVAPLPNGLLLKADTILDSMGRVNDYSVIWKRTGGMHCSLIIRENGEVVCGVEDMGRHTTVDKAVGIALLQGIDLCRCYLVCSGRLPVDMVAKAYRAGIPVMVSNNAAFAGGIEFAAKANMTLAGFVRPPRMTLYTGAHRIRFSSE
ncbi:formate dehydrogenase accessory sulfurtransferase FdhD [Methanosphaerula subterraneus]|uniref:formate dehydrogenase accessory sulfurtransferase FdhD n=1 Tax=Methanosphaerula subterraneus TaxID=3350244 RepID=UPI003F8611FC